MIGLGFDSSDFQTQLKCRVADHESKPNRAEAEIWFHTAPDLAAMKTNPKPIAINDIAAISFRFNGSFKMKTVMKVITIFCKPVPRNATDTGNRVKIHNQISISSKYAKTPNHKIPDFMISK
jgi:hypothetical protein